MPPSVHLSYMLISLKVSVASEPNTYLAHRLLSPQLRTSYKMDGLRLVADKDNVQPLTATPLLRLSDWVCVYFLLRGSLRGHYVFCFFPSENHSVDDVNPCFSVIYFLRGSLTHYVKRATTFVNTKPDVARGLLNGWLGLYIKFWTWNEVVWAFVCACKSTLLFIRVYSG